MNMMNIYKVGGFVRDTLLGKEAKDCDYVVIGSTEEEMLSLGYKKVGKQFPVFINPKDKCEYALARKEIKTGPLHTDFEFYFGPDITMEEDAIRRDLTINALYQNDCKIYDPTKKGLEDLHNKILRHISDHFVEDPLRVLRVCRFAAQLDFTIAKETLDLMKSMVKNNELENLTQERIDNEFIKALETGNNSSKFLYYLNEVGALEKLYPEIYKYIFTKENDKYHSTGSTWGHILKALDFAKEYTPQEKLAVIMHDIYKPIAYTETYKKLEGLNKENLSSEEYKKYYVAHDDENAIHYAEEFFKKHKFPLSYKTLSLVAIEYHMKLWKVFEIRPSNLIKLISDITRGFDSNHLYKLKSLLEICNADDKSDKTENCSLYDRYPMLKHICMLTFDICWNIKIRNIPGYQDLTLEQQVIRLNEIRIKEVKRFLNSIDKIRRKLV